MSLSRSVPQLQPELHALSQPVKLDYAGLLRFLIQPFLDSPESLKIDCEVSLSKPRVWIRVAFEVSDRGRVFGRGGRNIQAIRMVLEAAAKAAGQTVYLDIYGSSQVDHSPDGGSNSGGTGSRTQPSRRSKPGRRSPG